MKSPACNAKNTTLGVPHVLLLLLVINILTELVLQLGDRGLLGGMPHMRGRAYDLGAFQPDMHARQDHHFSGQSLSMFLTYGFLHTGLSHLIANMLGLVWMGKLILFYRTPATFLMFYLVCLVGGAQAYLVLYTQGGVMVGASGAVFGLLGVYAVDSGLFRSSRPRPEEAGVQFFRVSMATVLLALAEVGGQKLLGSSPMAWQAHAGGFLTGAVAALLMPPRLRDRQ